MSKWQIPKKSKENGQNIFKVLEHQSRKGNLNRLKFNLINIHLGYEKQDKAQKSHPNIKVQFDF